MENSTRIDSANSKLIIFLFFIIWLLLLGGCKQMPTQTENNLTINDIAYDINENLGYTLYLIENEDYVPYLILTSDYEGNVLLLRKHLIDEMMPYNSQGNVPSYYGESQIDSFLNEVFINSIAISVKDNIVDSTVTITDIESIGCVGTDTRTIQRKVFLLSYTETAQEESLVNAVEGTALKYFKDDPYAVCATTSSGEFESWWLRTPNTAYFNTVYGISPEGYVGVCSVGGTEGVYENGVRPAFCLPKDTVVNRGNINGEEVYIIQ